MVDELVEEFKSDCQDFPALILSILIIPYNLSSDRLHGFQKSGIILQPKGEKNETGKKNI
ncbi:MAG: hypothetical protein GY795_04250 [Desulfobacterales bacterium]|nr:hypothetical protein [Desulfobacterales bacterium]